MKDNLTIIKKEYEKIKGQFIIINNKIERLVGLGDDGEDYYYITFDGRRIIWDSCVGKIIPLKGHLKKNDYSYLKKIAELNHLDQVDKKSFIIFLNKYINNLPETDKFITKLCWDLN